MFDYGSTSSSYVYPATVAPIWVYLAVNIDTTEALPKVD
ncbi:hypothetical protein RSAG8_06227, partial [Rhizoctonia solani AG-8 WAC10335]